MVGCHYESGVDDGMDSGLGYEADNVAIGIKNSGI